MTRVGLLVSLLLLVSVRVEATSVASTPVEVRSPDGKKIVFEETGEAHLQLSVRDADGSNRRQLTHFTVLSNWSYLPRWAPDSTHIAFCFSDRGKNLKIYVVEADGSNLRQLTPDTAYSFAPAWSPDGKQIAFSSGSDEPRGYPRLPKDDTTRELYVIRVEGSNLRQLTHLGADSNYPAWSADGRQIAFSSTLDGDDEIYVMNADGSNIRQLTHNDVTDETPEWSRGGAITFYQRTGDCHSPSWIFACKIEKYTMNADGSELRKSAP